MRREPLRQAAPFLTRWHPLKKGLLPQPSSNRTVNGMLVDDIKQRIRQAMKAQATVEREILRVALGEIQTVEARSGSVTDEQAQGIVRKLLKSNEETLAISGEAAARATLEQENAVLRSLLPQTWSVEQIAAALEPVRDALRAAASDGQAVGIAMKTLKPAGAPVEGKDVAAAVAKIRA